MVSFLVFFFLIYGGAHAYALMRTALGLRLGWKGVLPLAALFLFMVFAPVIVHYLEKAGYQAPARALSFIGYTWMGIMFLFVSTSLAVDFYRVGLWVLGLLLRADLSRFEVPARLSVQVPLILAIIISVYGYFEALNIRVENLSVATSKLPPGLEKLRIVQVSDVHLGLIVRGKRLRLILEHVKNANPDILVSTGDLVDGEINRLPGIAEMLREINPRYGKYAVTGNHEYYAGLPRALEFTKKAGFTLLRGEAVSEGPINIAGVDDLTGRYYGEAGQDSEVKLLSSLPREKFTLFLKHRPMLEEASTGLFDLQLSGHSHKGQIFPFSLVTSMYYPTDAGRLELPEGAALYVSRGSGTWGPPIRFLAPPEVTIIEIIRKRK